MEAIDCLMTRRSVRSFAEGKKIPMEDLVKIVDAGRYAPSAMNRQSWKFTVVTDSEKIAALSAAVGSALGNSSYNHYNPSALIICSNERDFRLAPQDCACALENIFLAAHALGIGSVWINQLYEVCDEPGVRKLLTSFGLPESQRVIGSAALGYSDSDVAVRPKKDAGETVIWVK